jgi:hypothetical protein
VWKSKENGAVCVNTEEMIAEIEKVNRMQRSSGLIVGSADVKSLYPNLDFDFTIEKVCEMFSESEIGVEDVDHEELGLYLALTMEAKDMWKLRITEVCPEIKSNRGRPPTITSSGSEEVKEKRLKPRNPPRKKPDEFTKNTMLTEALRVALKVVMKNHVYLFDNEIRKQSKGGAIGLRLTGILAQIFLMWLNERYVDDIIIAAEATTPGLKYKNGQSYVDQSMIREEEKVEDDERTM